MVPNPAGSQSETNQEQTQLSTLNEKVEKKVKSFA